MLGYQISEGVRYLLKTNIYILGRSRTLLQLVGGIIKDIVYTA